MTTCIFCQQLQGASPVFLQSNDGLWLARWDELPVLPGHAEVLPRRHAVDMFELTHEELATLMPFVRDAQRHIAMVNLQFVYDQLLKSQTTGRDPRCIPMLEYARAQSPGRDWVPDGWTIGINDGPAAGQTVPHFELHIIPRLHADTPYPREDIRRIGQ